MSCEFAERGEADMTQRVMEIGWIVYVPAMSGQ
jgi:hypothetical protein